jgi:hypothetical protein
MAAICFFLPSKSKRVPELENPLLDVVRPVNVFAFHRWFPVKEGLQLLNYKRYGGNRKDESQLFICN